MSDFFNILLKSLHKAWVGLIRKRLKACNCPVMQSLLTSVLRDTGGLLEGPQFVACEGVKILRFLVGRKAIYLRNSSAAGNPDEEMWGEEVDQEGFLDDDIAENGEE